MKSWKFAMGWGLFWLLGSGVICAILGYLMGMEKRFETYAVVFWGFYCGWLFFGKTSPLKDWIDA